MYKTKSRNQRLCTQIEIRNSKLQKPNLIFELRLELSEHGVLVGESIGCQLEDQVKTENENQIEMK